jgi:putative addiction module antidote
MGPGSYNNRYNSDMKVKVTTVGSSTGIVLPKEALAKLRVSKGDVLYLTETPNGIQLSPYDPDFAEQLEVAEGVMRKYRNALRRLAK